MDIRMNIQSQNLKSWLEANNISLKELESISGVPYQRISEHIRLNKPLSEKHVAMILKATNCDITPESLRPSIKPIFELININTNSVTNGGTQMRREMNWFVVGLAIVMSMFALTIFKGTPENLTEVAMLESQQHFEEAQKAVSDNDLELALNHLEAIQERTPAWYESRELHWKVKEDLNMYAQKEAQKAVQ